MALGELNISTGNILSGIGNQGVSGEEIAKIFQAQTQQQANRTQLAKDAQNRKLWIGAASVTGGALFLVIIFLISKRIQS